MQPATLQTSRQRWVEQWTYCWFKEECGKHFALLTPNMLWQEEILQILQVPLQKKTFTFLTLAYPHSLLLVCVLSWWNVVLSFAVDALRGVDAWRILCVCNSSREMLMRQRLGSMRSSRRLRTKLTRSAFFISLFCYIFIIVLPIYSLSLTLPPPLSLSLLFLSLSRPPSLSLPPSLPPPLSLPPSLSLSLSLSLFHSRPSLSFSLSVSPVCLQFSLFLWLAASIGFCLDTSSKNDLLLFFSFRIQAICKASFRSTKPLRQSWRPIAVVLTVSMNVVRDC